jgi:hypothetical protein
MPTSYTTSWDLTPPWALLGVVGVSIVADLAISVLTTRQASAVAERTTGDAAPLAQYMAASARVFAWSSTFTALLVVSGFTVGPFRRAGGIDLGVKWHTRWGSLHWRGRWAP